MTAPPPAHRRDGLRRRALLALVLLVVLASGVGIAVRLSKRPEPPPLPPDVPSTESEQAVIQTIRTARERVLREPGSVNAWGSLGMAFLANDMAEECLPCFQQAERLDPDNPHWPYYHARALLSQAAPEAALPSLLRAVLLCDATDPDNVAPRLTLIETLLSLGREEQAEEHLHLVLEREPDNLRACFYRGILRFSRQRWQASQDDFRRCLHSPFAQKKACIKLTQLAQLLGDRAEAERLRQQAEGLPADQEWPDPYVTEYMEWGQKKSSRYQLAEQLEGMGRLPEAATVLRDLVEQNPGDYLPAMRLSRLAAMLGSDRDAELYIRRALEAAPGLLQTHYAASMVYLAKGEHLQQRGQEQQARQAFEEAARQAREALARKPDYGLAHMTLGRALRRLGKREEALASLRQAVRCNPEYGELHYHLADLLADLGQTDEARQQLEQSLRLTARASWRPAALARLKALSPEQGKQAAHPKK